jgi:hypothetical protein
MVKIRQEILFYEAQAILAHGSFVEAEHLTEAKN